MFSGSLVALITPMHADGSIDKKSLGTLIEWHIDQGTEGIVINGTTGESPTLEGHEQHELIQFTVDCVNNRIPVIAGTGSNSTAHTISNSQTALSLGADACLLVAPYYNKPTQEGLYQHYYTIAKAVMGPLILYNNPGRTCVDMQPEIVVRLMGLSNVVGIKEVLATKERVTALVNACGNDLDILCGDDAANLEFLEWGGNGVISAVANVAPAAVSALCRAALAKDWARAKVLEQQLAPLNTALFAESNPIAVKWALSQMNKIEPGIRLPLTPLTAQYHATVLAALKHANIL